jgi:hypothetical protein
MENGPFIDGLPIKNGGSFHGYVSHNQRVNHWMMGFKSMVNHGTCYNLIQWL